ncbi:MAG: hypothetical protein MZV64_43865 [Ignavibacteriales bacterium]|nr:hypothetical protein [Ignavibacteriales bacterium]
MKSLRSMRPVSFPAEINPLLHGTCQPAQPGALPRGRKGYYNGVNELYPAGRLNAGRGRDEFSDESSPGVRGRPAPAEVGAMTRRGGNAALARPRWSCASRRPARPPAGSDRPGRSGRRLPLVRLAEADALCAAGHYTGSAGRAADLRRGRGRVPRPGRRRREVRPRDDRPPSCGPKSWASSSPIPRPRISDAPSAADPSLARYAPWLELLAGLPEQDQGQPGPRPVSAGRDLDAQLDWINARGSRTSTGSSSGRPEGRRPRGRPCGWPCGRRSATSSRTRSIAKAVIALAPGLTARRLPGGPLPGLRARGPRAALLAPRPGDSPRSTITSARPRSWAESC